MSQTETNKPERIELPNGWYIEYPKSFTKGDPREGEYWLYDDKDVGQLVVAFEEHDALKFASAMNAPLAELTTTRAALAAAEKERDGLRSELHHVSANAEAASDELEAANARETKLLPALELLHEALVSERDGDWESRVKNFLAATPQAPADHIEDNLEMVSAPPVLPSEATKEKYSRVFNQDVPYEGLTVGGRTAHQNAGDWDMKAVNLMSAISALKGYTTTTGPGTPDYFQRLRDHYIAELEKAAAAFLPPLPSPPRNGRVG